MWVVYKLSVRNSGISVGECQSTVTIPLLQHSKSYRWIQDDALCCWMLYWPRLQLICCRTATCLCPVYHDFSTTVYLVIARTLSSASGIKWMAFFRAGIHAMIRLYIVHFILLIRNLIIYCQMLKLSSSLTCTVRFTLFYSSPISFTVWNSFKSLTHS